MRVDVDDRGRPTALRLAGRSIRNPQSAIRISEIFDQWRIDDEWWRKEVSRMYFSVALEGGQLLTLFHDLTSGRWYGQTSATPLPAERVQPVSAPAFGLPPAVAEPRGDSSSVGRAG
jgi:hypothetical protein